LADLRGLDDALDNLKMEEEEFKGMQTGPDGKIKKRKLTIQEE
jgi:hypothetical protein